MKVTALVPIKLNSQRLPHKNILPVLGKPLCHHIVSRLLDTKGIDDVYVYCSDKKVTDYIPDGAVFLQRDSRLDGDTVKGFDIYDAFIQEVYADVYVLAHTTSPFIKTSSLENGLRHILDGSHDSAFSAERIQTFAWYQNQPVNYDLNDVPRTQDMEPVWVETSAFYMFRREVFTEHRRRIGFHPYIQEVSGIEAVDIDTQEDYDFALELAKSMHIKNGR